MARVLVVEDDGFTRMLLCSQLRELGHDVVADAATCADGIASTRVTRPDVVIADLDLGSGPTGVDLAYAIWKFVPSTGVLLLSTYVDVRLIGDYRPLPPGTIFMVKRSLSDASTLESAIAMSLDRTSPIVFEQLKRSGNVARLRDGQVEIMRLVASGYTNAEIAKKRHLEEASVGKAISRLVGQLNLAVTSERNPRVLITQAYFVLISGSTGTRG
ncbi:MAG: response regulator [Candidatus Nanopelagicales bacterium]